MNDSTPTTAPIIPTNKSAENPTKHKNPNSAHSVQLQTTDQNLHTSNSVK